MRVLYQPNLWLDADNIPTPTVSYSLLHILIRDTANADGHIDTYTVKSVYNGPKCPTKIIHYERVFVIRGDLLNIVNQMYIYLRPL